MTFGITPIIFLANLLDREEIGFMSKPPVIRSYALVNYLQVTSLMTGTLILINQLVKYKHKKLMYNWNSRCLKEIYASFIT